MSDNAFLEFQQRAAQVDALRKAVRDGLQSGIVEARHIEAVLKEARNEDSFPFRFSQRWQFDYFIQEESKNYPDDKNNLFAFAFGQVGRYERFLTQILERYRRISAELPEVTRILTEPRKHSRWEVFAVD